MKSIGIRAEPDKVTYAIVEESSEDFSVVSTGVIKMPRSLEYPDQLRHVRTSVLTILEENEVNAAAIRTTEPTAKNKSLSRIGMEGMLTEALASAGISNLCAGPIAKLEPKLSYGKGSFKKVRETDELAFDDGWADRSEVERESILAAIAVLPNSPSL